MSEIKEEINIELLPIASTSKLITANNKNELNLENNNNLKKVNNKKIKKNNNNNLDNSLNLNRNFIRENDNLLLKLPSTLIKSIKINKNRLILIFYIFLIILLLKF